VVLDRLSMFISKRCSSSTPYRAFSFYYDWIGEMIEDGDVSSGLFINGLVACVTLTYIDASLLDVFIWCYFVLESMNSEYGVNGKLVK
jgi:hypothetical protein